MPETKPYIGRPRLFQKRHMVTLYLEEAEWLRLERHTGTRKVSVLIREWVRHRMKEEGI